MSEWWSIFVGANRHLKLIDGHRLKTLSDVVHFFFFIPLLRLGIILFSSLIFLMTESALIFSLIFVLFFGFCFSEIYRPSKRLSWCISKWRQLSHVSMILTRNSWRNKIIRKCLESVESSLASSNPLSWVNFAKFGWFHFFWRPKREYRRKYEFPWIFNSFSLLSSNFAVAYVDILLLLQFNHKVNRVNFFLLRVLQCFTVKLIVG